MKLLCWNVNGIRAVFKKGFHDLLIREKPDFLCVQETKIKEGQLGKELANPPSYHSEWSFAKRAGYSGVATFYKKQPKMVQRELGTGIHDSEGRLLLMEYPEFTLINVYIPNGGGGDERLLFKLDYYDEFFDFCERLRKKEKKNLVICGDFNTAHMEVDLARPKENENRTGFLPVERAWLDKFTKAGYTDIFRHLNPAARDAYTWWSFRTAARKRNVGWRIDYFFVNKEFLPHVKRAWILSDVKGSDHCPIGIEIE